MLGALITSKTRLKLLIKFFVSAGNTGYLRGIAEEFDESTNAIRKELNQLTEAGFLERKQEQKKVLYQANTQHPLFNPVQRLVHSFLGIDKVVDQVMERAGDVHEVMLVGAYAKGQESDQVEVVVLGGDLDNDYLENVAAKTEKLINKKIGLQFEKPTSGSYIVVYKK
ncbi:winged helix-turn-helix transcriptional regulator [Sphingobacterium sp. SGR-19]|nr:winged helix-turn-helix transcriptional regulator [Sphingobacterium sp. SGR-19]